MGGILVEAALEHCDTLWEDEDFAVSRCRQLGRDVLMVAPTSSRSHAACVARLEHAYGLRDLLEADWAARPTELVQRTGRCALLLEDPGGQVLARLMGKPWDVRAALAVGVGITVALGRLHRRGLVHKDLKPPHLLVNLLTGDAWLMGFGIASQLPGQRSNAEPPKLIAGTFAYMAPEQTGRMQRTVDSRSDLYSLGVVLYELLTGLRPFSASDPLEWIHCHIASEPTPFERAGKHVPAQLSRIVMKLLAKAAEDRYQSAHGLEHDLKRCLASWETHGEIESFVLGSRDIHDRLIVSDRLYGRDHAIAALVAAFERVAEGGWPELSLVAGYSGIGKSAVVNELRQRLAPARGLFAAGKFDQHKRDIPYATLTQAFSDLISWILSRPEPELTTWRGGFVDALGPNGQLICAIIPRLEQIIGKQPPVPELPAHDAQSRFQLIFSRFVSVFARHEQPLVLFLDDLQWVDVATLDILAHLLTQSKLKHVLLVGAYRDNEVGPTHPLRARLAAIKAASATVNELVLEPLELHQVNEFVATTLAVHENAARPLSELVQARAQGNPFFTIQFITALADEKLLVFDHDCAGWRWDLERVRTKGSTDNVVELMISKLDRLSAATQAILKRLACLGMAAQATTLSAVCALTVEQLHARLNEAVLTGLVMRHDDAYRFPHDRVQEAAYALILPLEHAELHLLTGRRLATHLQAGEREEAIFDIVNLFNRALDHIESQDERETVAAYNLLAARRSKAATAYASALVYLDAGGALLAEARWQTSYELAFALALLRAECDFLTGNLSSAEQQLAGLARQAQNQVDLAAVTCLRLDLFTVLDRSDRSVDAGLEYLRSLGVDWSAHPGRSELVQEYATFHAELDQRPIESLAALPLMVDPVGRATMDVLTKLQVPALFSDENLHGMVLGRMANISLALGNTDGSCFAYCWLAGFVGPHLGDYDAAPRFAKLSLDLVERPGLDRFKARVYCVFGYLVTPWLAPLSSGRAPLLRAKETARATGDLTFVVYSSNHLITLGLGAGDSLVELERDAERGREVAQEAHFGLVADFFRSQLTLIRSLRRAPAAHRDLDIANDDDVELERRLEGDPQLAIAACWHFIRKLQAHYHAKEYASAGIAAAKAERLLWTSTSSFEVAEYHFFAALNLAALATHASLPDKARHLAALTNHRRQIAIWAANCPANFAHRDALVGAEIARLGGAQTAAQRLYETAIRAAREQGFVHHESLAFELAAQFYADQGFDDFAVVYRQKARDGYARWGAASLVRQLEQRAPLGQQTAVPTTTVDLPLEQVDLGTVVQALQAVSKEIDPDKLIEQLMRSAVQHAVADRGLLILLSGAPRIRAIATTYDSAVQLRAADSQVTSEALPESLLTYVLRTGEKVVISDTRDAGSFSEDPYVQSQRARSLLCIPIVLQTKPLGALYLENSLAPYAFSPRGLVVLDLLASQAAISLENARLYSELRQAKAYMAHAERLSRTGSFSWRPDAQELLCSDEVFRIFGFEGTASLALLGERVHPEDRALVDSILADPARLERSALDQRLRMPDGSVKHLSVVAHRLADPPDARVEYVGTVRDVTAMKRAEEALQRTQLALADVTRVASLGEMAAAIAHEVNQPLAAITLNASTCLRWLQADSPNLPEVHAAATRIARDASLAADVIRRLRQLFAGSGSARAPVDLNEAIREVIVLAQSQGRTHGSVVSTMFGDDLPLVLGDRVQLQQVVMNLVVNAAEAMRGVEDRRREIRIQTSLAHGAWLRVAVRDTGVGVSAENVARIFDAFYTTKPHGMGIGLSMCNTIVKSHGGTLSVTTNDGPGATFTLLVPVSEPE